MNYFYLDNIDKSYTSKFGEIISDTLIEKKSKFISYIFKISDEGEAKGYIEAIKKDNPDARHVVYIYSYLNNGVKCIRFSDDGEPQGTGTKSILELLDKENISNICIVVVRYFGGILLGAGPLARAYLNSCRLGIKNCIKKQIYLYKEGTFTCDYSNYEKLKIFLDSYVSRDLLKIKDVKFGDDIKIVVDIEENTTHEIRNGIEAIASNYR